MEIAFRKSFRKDCKRLTARQKDAWLAAVRLFSNNSYHPDLRRHKLSGKYTGLESIDVLPDLRAVFLQEDDLFTFYYIRNHNQLYG